jgi:hypothetical protein
MLEQPAFIQGVFTATGRGLDVPIPLSPPATYTVPADKRAHTVYFRAGSPVDDLIAIALMRNGQLMRLFPIGAKQAIHIALAVLDDLEPGTKMELRLAAPAGLAVTVVVDVGFIEVG